MNELIEVGTLKGLGGVWDNMFEQSGRVYSNKGLCPTISTFGGGTEIKIMTEPQILRPTRTEYGKQIRKKYENKEIKESRHNMTELQPRDDGVSNTLTTVQKDNLLLQKTKPKPRIRKLTPLECWRLMGFEDSDFYQAQDAGISNSQAYKQAGNSIVTTVLCGIYENLFF